MMNGVIVGFGEVAQKGHLPAYEAGKQSRTGGRNET